MEWWAVKRQVKFISRVQNRGHKKVITVKSRWLKHRPQIDEIMIEKHWPHSHPYRDYRRDNHHLEIISIPVAALGSITCPWGTRSFTPGMRSRV